MQKTPLLIALVTLTLLGSQAVLAQPGPGPDRRTGPTQQHVPPKASAQKPPPSQHRPGPAVQSPHHRPQAYRPPHNTRPPKHYNHYQFSQHRQTPHGDLRPGYVVPKPYRHKQYVVTDWRMHRLYAPPHGYHWVQVSGDYVLVAIASGIVTQILMGY